MKKQEILRDFVKYCHDLKLDEKKKSTKTKRTWKHFKI